MEIVNRLVSISDIGTACGTKSTHLVGLAENKVQVIVTYIGDCFSLEGDYLNVLACGSLDECMKVRDLILSCEFEVHEELTNADYSITLQEYEIGFKYAGGRFVLKDSMQTSMTLVGMRTGVDTLIEDRYFSLCNELSDRHIGFKFVGSNSIRFEVSVDGTEVTLFGNFYEALVLYLSEYEHRALRYVVNSKDRFSINPGSLCTFNIDRGKVISYYTLTHVDGRLEIVEVSDGGDKLGVTNLF